MKTRICFSLIIVIALVLAVASACKSDSAKTLTLVAADDGWDSQKFHNAMAKIVIEHAYDGYKLEFSTASSTMNWQSLKGNDVDLCIEQWIDTIPTYEDDLKNGEIIVQSVIVEDSYQGIYVPRYVVEGDPSRGLPPLTPDLKRIEDLTKYAHVFPDDEDHSRGRLYGSIPGWMTDAVLYKRYLNLGLDKHYNYVRLGSEAALFLSLASAYNLGEPWVGYCYEPTWVIGKLDMIRLEDVPYDPIPFLEGKTGFSTQELLNISSRNFPEKSPEILQFIQKYKTSSSLLSSALAYLDESKATHEAAAIWFLKNNDSIIDNWVPPANAAKLRAYLSKK